MNINASRVSGREGVKDLGLRVLEECDVYTNNIWIFNEAASICSLYCGITTVRSSENAKFGLVKILTLTGYSSVIIFDDQLAIRIFKKMASIDANKQVSSECIKKALNYSSSGGRDIVLKSEQRVAIDVLEEMHSQFCQPLQCLP